MYGEVSKVFVLSILSCCLWPCFLLDWWDTVNRFLFVATIHARSFSFWQHETQGKQTFSILVLAAISCSFLPCSLRFSDIRASSSSVFSSVTGSVNGNWTTTSEARMFSGSWSRWRRAGKSVATSQKLCSIHLLCKEDQKIDNKNSKKDGNWRWFVLWWRE